MNISKTTYPFRFQIGERTLFSSEREVTACSFSIRQRLDGVAIPEPQKEGTVYRGIPAAQLPVLATASAPQIFYVRERFPNYYADISGTFDDYMATMSSSARSSLKRKVRKFQKFCGGQLDIRTYGEAAEMPEFHRLARQVSKYTYQEKMLDAGLPDDAAFQEKMLVLANAGQVKGWILFHQNKPVSYLYCPVVDRVVIYAFLGYLPEFSNHSVGSVLQYQAMQDLFAEKNYDLFDFTSGDGQHKRQFSTGHVDCADVIILPASAANRALVAAHKSFHRAVEAAGKYAGKLGIKARLKRMLRGS